MRNKKINKYILYIYTYICVCMCVHIYIYILIHMHIYTCFSLWLCSRILGWRMSQLGFNISFENLVCLAKLKSCDTTKQSVCK